MSKAEMGMSLRQAWNRLQEHVQLDYAGCDELHDFMNEVAAAIAAEIILKPSRDAIIEECVRVCDAESDLCAKEAIEARGRFSVERALLFSSKHDTFSMAAAKLRALKTPKEPTDDTP